MPNVLITGADRGLGLSLCKEYLQRGWTVFAGKFMEDFTLLEDLQAQNTSLHILWLDVGCEDSINEAVQAIIRTTDHLDMLISNAALMGDVKCKLYEPPMELEQVWDSFRVNALGPLLLVEKFMPLLEKSKEKRLCFVSSEVACITLMQHRHDSPYPYPMSKAAMNMGIRIMHNYLHPKGYTFRLFHPGWMKKRAPDGSLSETALYDPDFIGEIAAKYFDKNLGDEHRLVMVDYNGYEWPW
ncbi:MAG: SDR family NAD(P)-dependent oxidoreductase [Defluviitaleaceae bacterium]|nr:SDR family NAD(P)-dependent oxidoreductase [Defluviitaleaceae bacterium]MCL2273970.1 SDR family NAD(P)-dependent oxidoreductase [Defluviitaleaceae bacterium]